MKWIALLSLICLVGGASAQAMFTGEGYGTSQLAFLNGPGSTPFAPNVEKYWNSYILNSSNLARPAYNPATSMNIWLNTFPLNFNQPVLLRNSTLKAGLPSTSKYTPAEYNSMQLKSHTLNNFDQDQSWKYGQIYAPGVQKTSIATNASTSGPTAAESGKTLSQSIKTGFSY